MLNDLRWRKAIAISGLAHVVVLGCAGYSAKEVFISEKQQNYMNVFLIDGMQEGFSKSTPTEFETLEGIQEAGILESSVPHESDLQATSLHEEMLETIQPVEEGITVLGPAAFLETDVSPEKESTVEQANLRETANLQIDISENSMDEMMKDLSVPVQIEAKVLYGPMPDYPLELQEKHLQGCVTVRILILKNGCVGAAQVLQSSGEPLLDQAALETARTWEFEPALDEQGQAVVSQRVIPFDFAS